MFVKEVTTRKDLDAFIQFPKRLYKGCPHYVPPLDSGERAALTRHPALEFCKLKLWLAYNADNQIVGRIAGIINEKSNALKAQTRVRFSWFDFVEDEAVARMLIRAVEEWGLASGMTEICGPSRFSNMDRQSMLVEGFDTTLSIAEDYNFPYYPAFMDAMGFEKEADYIKYRVRVRRTPETIERLAERVQRNSRVRLRKIRSKRELLKLGQEFFSVINKSYTRIFNFIPLTDKEIARIVKNEFTFAVLDLVSVLEDENGKLVGISFCVPSLSEAFRKAGGRLLPTGIFHILRALRRNRAVDMYLTGVLPEYSNSGIHLLYHKHLNETFLERGYEWAFTSQQLEDNPAARIWQKYEAEIFCRRRCYKKGIDKK